MKTLLLILAFLGGSIGLIILITLIGLIIATIRGLDRPPSKSFYEIYWDDKDD